MPRLLPFLLLTSALLTAVPAQDEGRVVVYVSHDQEHSERILDLFEARTGIEVAAKFDTEANKTVGLVNQLISERDDPRADVFWNNECGQTERLRREGLLAPYVAENSKTIPEQFKDPNGYWCGFGARARVIIYDTTKHGPEDLPQTLDDLASEAFRGRIAMAKPLTGTTMTHVGALYATWGEERTDAWLEAMIDNQTLWLSGNGPVAQRVAEGERPFGLTDTDDVNVRRLDGFPVASHYLGQGEDGEGTLVIPNSVMLVKGHRNGPEAKRLIEFLLSPEVEGLLAEGRAAQMPLHPGVEVPENVTPVSELKTFAVDFSEVGEELAARGDALGERFNRIGAGGKVSVNKDAEDAGRSSIILLVSVLALLVVGLVVVAVLRSGRGEDA